MAQRKSIILNQGFFEELNTPTDKLDLDGNSTSDLVEGSRLYYTDARARAAISLTTTNPSPNTGLGSLAYNSSTGAFTFTQVTDADVRAQLSATTSTGISYTSSTGVFALGNIPNASLTNSSITFENARGVSTAVSLGDTYQIKEAESVIELVRNESGSTIAKGTPVAIVGYAAGSGRPLIAPADANDVTKMPCIGLVAEQIPDGNNGVVIATGISLGYDTSTFTVGDTLYIDTTAGDLRNTPPPGEASQIQNIGKVSKADSNGRILVSGPGRSNSTPNLDNGKIFIGNASNQSSTATLTTSIVTEGTNEYFTQARARTSISVTDNGGDGSLGYDSGSGVLTYTGPSDAEVRAHFSAATATGISFNSGTGQFSLSSIPNASLTYSSITIGTTGIALGASATVLAGLSSVTSNAVLTNAGSGGIAIRDPSDATRIARFDCSLIATGTTRTFKFPNASGTLLTSASASFVDNAFEIVDNGDATKILQFQCDQIATSTTRTMTVPNEDGTISTQEFATAIAVALG